VEPRVIGFASFVARRFVRAVITLLSVILITFILFWSFPTGPEQYVYGDKIEHHTVTDADVADARHQLGLDRPKVVQAVDYVAHLARGDFGKRWQGTTVDLQHRITSQPPVGPSVFPFLWITLSILLGGALLVLALSVPLGAIAGTRIGSWTDRGISVMTVLFICTHPMMLGLMLGSAAHKFGWFLTDGYCPLNPGPVGSPQTIFFAGTTPTCGGLAAWTTHLILPWITFALLFLALYTRMIRSSVADTMHEDFVRTARAKGASEARVVRRHVLPTASLRVLTMVGMEVGTAIGVAAYIEAAFHIRGLGTLAIFSMGGGSVGLDLPFVLALVVVITLVVVIGTFVIDVLHAALDPRRSEIERTKSFVGGVI
jgi:peptide/nickel transport system permease protein